MEIVLKIIKLYVLKESIWGSLKFSEKKWSLVNNIVPLHRNHVSLQILLDLPLAIQHDSSKF